MNRENDVEVLQSDEKEKIWRRMWRYVKTVFYVIGCFFILVIFLMLSIFDEQKDKSKKVETPNEQIQTIQKEVDRFYDKEEVAEKEGEELYDKLRQTEAHVLKEGKANDEKTLLLTRIGLMKQDVLHKME